MSDDILYPFDCEAEDLPDIGMDGKDVRIWLRDNSPDDELPASFNHLVSYATNSELKPYINHAGTWPLIVKTWVGWAWENNKKEAAVRLVTAALSNTNATADQSVWMDIYEGNDPSRREAMLEAFKEVLPSALHCSLNERSLFSKNISCVLNEADVWCTPGCIESISDEKVLQILKTPCKDSVLFQKITSLWLNDENISDARIAMWSDCYCEHIDSTTGRFMVENIALCSPKLNDKTRLKLFNKVEPGHHRFVLLKEVLNSFTKARIRPSAHDCSTLYSNFAEQTFELDLFTKKDETFFNNLRAKEVWREIPYERQRRLAILVALYFAATDYSWADWYNEVAPSIHLQPNLFALVSTLELTSWPELVAQHETEITKVELPTFDLNTSM